MVIYHRFVQRDLTRILKYYRDEAGSSLADRFFDVFIATVVTAEKNPEFFHPFGEGLRRANLKGFPYHFLYRRIDGGIKVLILRHHSRDSLLGLKRR